MVAPPTRSGGTTRAHRSQHGLGDRLEEPRYAAKRADPGGEGT